MAVGRGLAGLRLEFPEAVKLVRLFERGRVAFALLREDVEEHRLVLRLEKLERPDQQRDIVAVDRTVIAQAEFLEDHARDEQVLDAGLDLVREIAAPLPPTISTNCARFLVEMGVGRVGDDPVEVAGDGADVLGDRPFVVVEHDDEALGLLRRRCSALRSSRRR